MEPRDRSRGEHGFTLIELLVVILVIGILAAIAIPAFLQHRERSYDVAVESDLRNAALAQDAYLTEGLTAGDWATTLAELQAIGFRPSADRIYFGGAFAMTLGGTPGNYCLTARSASGLFLGFGSATGGVQSEAPIDPDTCTA